MKLPHEVEAEFFITERLQKRAGESPKHRGSVDLVLYVVRTAGDAVEKHTCPSPTRVCSRGAVCGAGCAPRRPGCAREAGPACGLLWRMRGHSPALGSGQQCVWAAVTWHLEWHSLRPRRRRGPRHAQPQGLGESRSACGAGGDGCATITPRLRHAGVSRSRSVRTLLRASEVRIRKQRHHREHLRLCAVSALSSAKVALQRAALGA